MTQPRHASSVHARRVEVAPFVELDADAVVPLHLAPSARASRVEIAVAPLAELDANAFVTLHLAPSAIAGRLQVAVA